MNEQASKCVIALAQLLIETMQRVNPKWHHAFLRIDAEEGTVGARSSYTNASGVQLLGSMEEPDAYRRAVEIGEQLWSVTRQGGRGFKVCLLIADAAFNYGVKFEYEDAGKWMITKMNGATGVPVEITTADLADLGGTSSTTMARRPWYRFW